MSREGGLRPMTLRTRFALAAGVLALIVIAMVGFSAYFVTSSQLTRQVDANLDGRSRQVAERLGRRPGNNIDVGPRNEDFYSDRDAITQVIFPDLSVLSAGSVALPVNDTDELLLARESGYARGVVSIDGISYRTLSRVLANGAVLKIGINTRDTEDAQNSIRLWFIGIGAVGFAMAAAAGWLFAARTARPIELLAGTAEQIAATQNLDHSIELGGEAEISRLARSFNTMLAALRSSRLRQQQLVQDASHELRTPLTSLRANTELLQRDGLGPSDRASILADMRAEIDELAALGSELNSLATDQRAAESPTTVDLVEVAHDVAARAKRRTAGEISVESTGPALVEARPHQLERAVQNLVDNAIKFGPPDSAVRIVVDGRRIEVHDSGPGIPDADKPYVFDRFYRAVESRSLPGSGLGLSIVSQFAEDNGAVAFVRDGTGGGAVVGIDFAPDESRP